jgi:hypothetical protein
MSKNLSYQPTPITRTPATARPMAIRKLRCADTKRAPEVRRRRYENRARGRSSPVERSTGVKKPATSTRTRMASPR